MNIVKHEEDNKRYDFLEKVKHIRFDHGTISRSGFDFTKQPTNKKEETEWLIHAIIHVHRIFSESSEFLGTKFENDHQWLPFYVGTINTLEKANKVILSSGWFMVMREYWYFPKAWNSMPFKLKINRDWGGRLNESKQPWKGKDAKSTAMKSLTDWWNKDLDILEYLKYLSKWEITLKNLEIGQIKRMLEGREAKIRAEHKCVKELHIQQRYDSCDECLDKMVMSVGEYEKELKAVHVNEREKAIRSGQISI